MLKLQLAKDLRKNILRGHPWVYKEALKPFRSEAPGLCQLLDNKGKPLGWGLHSPQSPLAVRVLSTEKKPPNINTFTSRILGALQTRQSLLPNETNAYRLLNGEGDNMPGLICDIYNRLAVVQFDGPDCREFWQQQSLWDWMLENLPVETLFLKPRARDEGDGQILGTPLSVDTVLIRENGVVFEVNFREGQKTGFFLDQRDNRQYVKNLARGRRVLNLFSYTGGFSVYAGLGDAQHVTSVDIAQSAIAMASLNWRHNKLPDNKHTGLCADVFDFVKTSQQKWDLVIVDPPSMTHSEKTKNAAMKSYTDLFTKTFQLVQDEQHICLSSCSSHIQFDDFFEIINESLSQVRRTAKILRVSGQGADHPYPHYCPEMRYLKFVHLQLNEG